MYYRLDYIFFLWTESSFYPGGEREGLVDLTVQRDVVTGLPIVRSSSIKGALRSYFELNGFGNVDDFFGSSSQVGSIVFSDAHVLLFPVSEVRNVFVYLMGRIPLMNLDLMFNYADRSKVGNIPSFSSVYSRPQKPCVFNGDGKVDFLLFGGTDVVSCEADSNFKSLVDFLVKTAVPSSSGVVSGYSYIMEVMKSRALFISDDVLFRDFVNRGIERVVRIGIDYERKVVKRGNLFTQELIPRYTLMFFGVFSAVRSKGKIKAADFVKELFGKNSSVVINLGGDESIGRGVIRLVSFGPLN